VNELPLVIPFDPAINDICGTDPQFDQFIRRKRALLKFILTVDKTEKAEQDLLNLALN
jgi:hypothetical protein